MYRPLPAAELAVVPGANHGAFFSEKVAAFQSLMLDFLLRHSAQIAREVLSDGTSQTDGQSLK
jgi:hypothetical protein